MDQFADDKNAEVAAEFLATEEAASQEIGFRDAMFTWSNDDNTDGSVTPSRHRFTLRIDDELLFKRGRINLVVCSFLS